MLLFLRLMLSPLISFFLLMLGSGFLMTFIPIRAGVEGFSSELAGYLASAYFAGILIGGIKIHKIIQGIGHIRAFAFFASAISILTLFQGFYVHPVSWILMRFLFGLGIGGIFITIESWLLVKSNKKNRGIALSCYMTTLYGGAATGQLFLNFFEPDSIYPFCLVVILTSFSVLLLAITKTQAPIIEEISHLSPLKLFKIAPLAVLGALFSGLLLGPIYGLLPIFAQGQDYTNNQISWIMLSTIFGGLIFQWPIGLISDFIDRRKVLLMTSILAGCLALLACFFSSFTFSTFIIFSVIFGGVCFAVYPLSLAHACDIVDTQAIIAATGAILVAYGLGSILGPIIASYSMALFGLVGLFYFLAIVAIGSSLSATFRIFLSAKVPQKEKLPYTNLPQTTPIASELDPRTETSDE